MKPAKLVEAILRSTNEKSLELLIANGKRTRKTFVRFQVNGQSVFVQRARSVELAVAELKRRVGKK